LTVEKAMRKEIFDISFVTPTFLGDAEQKGRWRTPPFKAQLRQWWRVAYAASHGFRVSVADMRREEGLLFGNAWLTNAFAKSRVRLRLDRWEEGKLRSWQGLEQSAVFHPEVQRTHFRVGPHAYLAYGPLDGRGGTELANKGNAAIQAAESAMLGVALPDNDAPLVDHALWLMDRYGTVGGRSRNGWGSYGLKPMDDTPALSGTVPLRDWRDCLTLDWPHAIGKDEKGALIWQTAPHVDWKALMRTLAIVKIGLRTQFRFNTGNYSPRTEDRHWLSYPVTNHSVAAWGRNARLPNQLRFKVRRTQKGQLVGVIFHMPHLPPKAFNPDRPAIEAVWRCVHAFLDALCEPANQRRYCDRANAEALGAQQAQLDTVQLQRIQE
jgi:CRISPR-associated protein Cmr1